MRQRQSVEPAGSDSDHTRARRRPFGVVVIVIIQLASLLAIGSLEFLRPQPPFQFLWAILEEYRLISVLSRGVDGLRTVIGFVLPQFWLNWLAQGLLLLGLVIAAGLWWLRRWAWVLLMMQVGLTMLVDLGLYSAGQPRFLSMLSSVVIVFYLNQRDVRNAFGRRRASQLPEAS